ncbi:RidA family protein [Leucobacter sp.]
MTRFITEDPALAAEYGLSSAAVAGGLVFAASMALDGETMQREARAVTIEDETRLCLQYLDEVLKTAGTTGLGSIVKINCYLADDADRAEFWRTYDEVFQAHSQKHVRITQVVGIACGCRVELDAVAVAPEAA